MQKMRVLLLTWDFPPAKGGIQVWMFELARRLPDAEVTVIAPAAKGDRAFDESAGIRVGRLGGARLGRAGWFIHLLVATIWRCLVGRPQLIACGHVVTAPAALLSKWIFRVPYVIFTHAWEIRRKQRRWLVSLILRQASMVLANSRFTEQSVLSHEVPPGRVRLIHPGADAARFQPPTNGHQPPQTGGRKSLVSVSRLDDLYKGHDTVIRSLPLIKAKYSDVRYLVVGDGRLRDYFRQLARSLGVEADVILLGEVPDESLSDLYRTCDVYVQMSREAGSGGGAEGFGIVCLEAAACGKPVVAGRSGGLPDAVEDGVTGILVDPTDVGAVAEAILCLLQDPALAERMGQAGRARVLREFTWDHMAYRARRLFAEAAGQVWEGTPERSEA